MCLKKTIPVDHKCGGSGMILYVCFVDASKLEVTTHKSQTNISIAETSI